MDPETVQQMFNDLFLSGLKPDEHFRKHLREETKRLMLKAMAFFMEDMATLLKCESEVKTGPISTLESQFPEGSHIN